MEKNFFKRLIDSKDPLSNKRFISLVGLFLLVVVVLAAIGGKIVPDSITIALVSLISIGIGASVIDKNKL